MRRVRVVAVRRVRMVAVPVPTESKGLQSRAELSQLKEEHTVDLFHHTPAHATAYREQNDGGAPTASARARALPRWRRRLQSTTTGWRVSDEELRRRNYCTVLVWGAVGIKLTVNVKLPNTRQSYLTLTKADLASRWMACS